MVLNTLIIAITASHSRPGNCCHAYPQNPILTKPFIGTDPNLAE